MTFLFAYGSNWLKCFYRAYTRRYNEWQAKVTDSVGSCRCCGCWCRRCYGTYKKVLSTPGDTKFNTIMYLHFFTLKLTTVIFCLKTDDLLGVVWSLSCQNLSSLVDFAVTFYIFEGGQPFLFIETSENLAESFKMQ